MAHNNSEVKDAWDRYCIYFSTHNTINRREYWILKMSVAGLTYKQIGDIWGISTERTRQILAKTCAKIRKEAVRVNRREYERTRHFHTQYHEDTRIKDVVEKLIS